MGLRTKILNKVKTIFVRDSSRAEHPQESSVLPDVLIAPGQPPRVGTHAIRPDSPGDNDAMGRQPTASRSDRERTEHTVANKILGALGRERKRTNTSDRQDVDSSERVHEIPGINPSTSDNRNRRARVHRAAARNNKDGELHIPSGRPPMGHSLSESTRFDNINHSAISIGGGTVKLSNNSFSGGIHHHNPSERIRPGLKLLQKRVATSAFHNSAQRVDPPRCHENTRVAILKQISDWIQLDFIIRQAWIMWVHGAAGGGKSAIMQSIADLSEQAQIPLASFFFFRTDPTRNSMALFIATIVYQLIQLIPQVQDEILGIIENNPLIFDQSVKSQLEKLVIQPLLRVREHFKGFFIILIDGLDECTERAHQVDLIQLLGTVSRSRTIPVVFLVASRREPQIEAAFVRKQVSDLVLTLALDNSDIEQTSDDIRRFLTDKFLDITETHLRRHLLPTNWPQVSSVEEIVTKSSGQFIYASVVINYVSSPRGNPAHFLEIVRGIRLREPSSQNPFAHLDALYQHIFSQVEALDKVLDILAHILITNSTDISQLEGAFLLEDGGLEVYLADLTSVIKIDSSKWTEIEFLHASLPDFLRDKTRSERYHIDVEEYRPKLLCMFLDRVPPLLDPLSRANDLHGVKWQEYFRLQAIKDLLTKGVKALDQIRCSFMTFNTKFYKDHLKGSSVTNVVGILRELKQLDFDDEDQAYHHVLNVFAAEFAKYWSLLNSSDIVTVKKIPDLLARISQIRQEEL